MDQNRHAWSIHGWWVQMVASSEWPIDYRAVSCGVPDLWVNTKMGWSWCTPPFGTCPNGYIVIVCYCWVVMVIVRVVAFIALRWIAPPTNQLMLVWFSIDFPVFSMLGSLRLEFESSEFLIFFCLRSMAFERSWSAWGRSTSRTQLRWMSGPAWGLRGLWGPQSNLVGSCWLIMT